MFNYDNKESYISDVMVMATLKRLKIRTLVAVFVTNLSVFVLFVFNKIHGNLCFALTMYDKRGMSSSKFFGSLSSFTFLSERHRTLRRKTTTAAIAATATHTTHQQ